VRRCVFRPICFSCRTIIFPLSRATAPFGSGARPAASLVPFFRRDFPRMIKNENTSVVLPPLPKPASRPVRAKWWEIALAVQGAVFLLPF